MFSTLPDRQPLGRRGSTYLRGSPQILVLDNLATNAMVGGTDLHRVLTVEDELVVRPLGSSSEERLRPRCIWIGTLNNPDVDPEQARRTVIIGLLHEPGRPRLTDDLVGWIIANRRLVIAALVWCVRKWASAGKPKPARSLDGYRDWSDLVSGVVTACCTRDAWLAPEHRPTPRLHVELAALFANWPRKGLDEELTPLRAKEVVAVINELGLWTLSAAVEGRGERGTVTRLGALLKEVSEKRAIHGGCRLDQVRGHDGIEYVPVLATDTAPPGPGAR